MKEIYKINDLDQVRLLADPLKLRLVQAFAEGPKTTKQVAAEIGESVTKLYRHVDALHDAGLLEIAAERRKRGTIERSFCAVATHFEADHTLFFDTGDDQRSAAIRDMLRAGEEEIISAIANAGQGREPIVMRLRIKASEERIDKLRDLLKDWIRAAEEEDESSADATAQMGTLIAFYPLEN